MSRSRNRGVAVLVCLIAIIVSAPALGQVIGREYPKDMPPPPGAWKGLGPGRDKLDEAARARIGQADDALDWYSALKYEFKVPGRPGITDNVLARRNHVVGTIEAVTPIKGCETLDTVRAKLGEPEHTIILSKQRILDYAGKGFRFIANNADGRIVGTACFPPRRRVPDGEPRACDLSKQRQGPLPPPANAKPWQGLKVGFASVPLGLDDETIKGLKKADQLKKVLDPLQARCCYISYQGESVALIGADIFGMLRIDMMAVFDRLKEQGHPNVVVGMSHTHAAPDTIGVYGFFPNKYNRSVKRALYQSVTNAIKAARPAAQVKVVSVELPLDGARVAGVSRNVRNPGLVNPQLAVITFHDAADKVLGTLVHYACHPEILDSDKHKLFSADFVTPLRNHVDKALGAPTVFLNGALGGMVTADSPGRRPVDLGLMGEKLAKYVVQYAKLAQPTPERGLRVVRRPIQVPPTNRKLKAMASAKGKGKLLVGGRIPIELYYIRLGSAEFITAPGELFPEIGFDIQARMTGYPRMIVGLANDELGYIVPGYDFDEKNYEESMSVGAAMGPMIREAAYQLATVGARK